MNANAKDRIRQLKDAIRNPYGQDGNEQAIYLSDGERICIDCAREHFRLIAEATRDDDNRGWGLMGIEIYWEGPPQFCVQCSKEMESCYGIPE